MILGTTQKLNASSYSCRQSKESYAVYFYIMLISRRLYLKLLTSFTNNEQLGVADDFKMVLSKEHKLLEDVC